MVDVADFPQVKSRSFLLPFPQELTIEVVRELLRYDPKTGKLFWKRRSRRWFKSEGIWKSWNKKYAGKEALTAQNNYGYLHGNIFKRDMLSHRIIWLLCTGEWPTGQVDHINGDRADNRIENLRDVTGLENRKNQKLRSDNPSGFIGVFQHKETKRWGARIGRDGKTLHLGYFSDKEDAIAARAAAEQILGFHENHGREA